MRLRAALGLFTQSPGYEKLVQSDYFVDLTDIHELRLPYERATHFILGAEKELGPELSARVEGYYKSYSSLVVGRLETELERLARVNQYDFPPELQDSVPIAPIIVSAPSNDSGGRAYGLDLYLARRDRIRQDLGVGLLHARKSGAGCVLSHLSHGIRPETLFQCRGSISLGRALRHRFDRQAGFGRSIHTRDRIAGWRPRRTGRLVPDKDSEGSLVYAADFGSTQNLNTGRLPIYARLDLRATFRPGGRDGRWSVYVEAINALNRDNAVRLDTWLTHDPTSTVPRIIEVPSEGFPFLPSVGVRFRF